MIEFGHISHVGLRRELNEDTYYGDSELGLWLVARKVLPGSPAAAVGLEPGDAVLGWFRPGRFGEQEQPLQSRAELAEMLAAVRGRSVRIVVLRGDDALVGTLDVRGAQKR